MKATCVSSNCIPSNSSVKCQMLQPNAARRLYASPSPESCAIFCTSCCKPKPSFFLSRCTVFSVFWVYSFGRLFKAWTAATLESLVRIPLISYALLSYRPAGEDILMDRSPVPEVLTKKLKDQTANQTKMWACVHFSQQEVFCVFLLSFI
jgi:hypothetical protein